jgi:hypothetical protein
MELFKPISANGTNAIVATTTSQSRALPGTGITAVFYNDGPNLAFVNVGDSTVSATAPALSTNAGAAGSMPIPVGQAVPVRIDPANTYWAVVGIGAANVYCSQGQGV